MQTADIFTSQDISVIEDTSKNSESVTESNNIYLSETCSQTQLQQTSINNVDEAHSSVDNFDKLDSNAYLEDGLEFEYDDETSKTELICEQTIDTPNENVIDRMTNAEIENIKNNWDKGNNLNWYSPKSTDERIKMNREKYGRHNQYGLFNYLSDAIPNYRKKSTSLPN